MKTSRCVAVFFAVLAAVAMAAPGPLSAAQPAVKDAPTVNIFEGMKNDQLEVRVVMQNENKGRIIVRNKTQQPLNVQLPEVMATVPVLAQIGGGGIGGGGGGQGGGIGGGGGGAAFNIPPEKVARVDVIGLCLEHGKPSPNSSMKYTLVPIDEYTQNAQLQELLRMYLKTGPQSAPIFQAAVWHVANGLSWQELAAKKRHHLGGQPDEAYFSPAQLRLAYQAAELAQKKADERPSSGQTSTTPVSVR